MPFFPTPTALLALLLAGCEDVPGASPWSSPTDPTVERPGDTDVDTDVDTDTDADTGLPAEVDLATADAKLVGETIEDRVGAAIATGDVSGDGVPDVVVGAPHAGRGETGVAYVVTAPISGTVDLFLADAKLIGEETKGYTGGALATGDMDGDGFEDVLVGAPWEHAPGPYTGAVYLVLGPVSGEVGLSEADAKLVGEDAYTAAGSSLASGDVNGDGLDDVLVGVPYQGEESNPAGAAYVVLGPIVGTFDLSQAEAKFNGEDIGFYGLANCSVATGDLNGDGVDDLLVGAPNLDASALQSGAVYLIHSPVTGTMSLSEADAKLVGVRGSNAGCSVAAGDVDGDGLDDALIGAQDEQTSGTEAGAAYLVIGPFSGEMGLTEASAKLVGEAADDHAGHSVAAGDVDGDGVEDVLVGAYTADPDSKSSAGAAYLVIGPVSGTMELSEADAKLMGENEGDHAGGSLATGDLDADGLDDVLIGARGEDTGGEGAGAVYLLFGRGF